MLDVQVALAELVEQHRAHVERLVLVEDVVHLGLVRRGRVDQPVQQHVALGGPVEEDVLGPDVAVDHLVPLQVGHRLQHVV